VKTRPSQPPCKPTAFTLVELLVVLAIVALLSALMLSGLASALRSQKREATKRFISRLSDAVMEAYEDAEDEALRFGNLQDIRRHLRSVFPDSWAEVLTETAANTPLGRAYGRFRDTGTPPSSTYQGAECLYMIITQSGRFPELLSTLRANQVGDKDGDGKPEFLDAWGNPIAFLRWAPGFVAPGVSTLTIQVADPVDSHDPFDRWYRPPPMSPLPGSDDTAYALFPLIYSPGPDEAGNAGGSGYGLLRMEAGWSDGDLNTLCGLKSFPNGLVGLVGAPDPNNPDAHRDNITNFELMLE